MRTKDAAEALDASVELGTMLEHHGTPERDTSQEDICTRNISLQQYETDVERKLDQQNDRHIQQSTHILLLKCPQRV